MPVLGGPKSNPWLLKTSPGTVDYTLYTAEKPGQKILVCTVQAWFGSPNNSIGSYLPPLMKSLGLCELEHNPKNNRRRDK